MPTLSDARKAIANRWIAQWATTTPFCFDNEAFDQPNTSHVRMIIRHNDGGQETLGPITQRRFYRRGTIFLILRTPADIGTSTADTLAQQARAIFEGTVFNSIRCYGATTREFGNFDGDQFQITIEIPFEYEEVK